MNSFLIEIRQTIIPDRGSTHGPLPPLLVTAMLTAAGVATAVGAAGSEMVGLAHWPLAREMMPSRRRRNLYAVGIITSDIMVLCRRNFRATIHQ